MRYRARFRRDLKDLLTKYEIDKYCDLHSHMLSEHLVRWLEEYARQQHVAKEWNLSSDDQQPYYSYMAIKGSNDDSTQPDSPTTVSHPPEE